MRAIVPPRSAGLQERADGVFEPGDVGEGVLGGGVLVAGEDRLDQRDVFANMAGHVGQPVQEQAPDPRRVGVEADEDVLEVGLPEAR